MTFANPLLLILMTIPLGIGVFFYWCHRRYYLDLTQFAANHLLTRIAGEHVAKFRWQWLSRFLALIFLVLAIAGPQWGYQWQEVKQRGLEIVFALDTSKSMLATDIKPSRLERAKLAVKDFLAQVQSDKVGLVAFSGTSFLQCPLTMDYNAFGIALDALNTQSIPQGGTAIGAAIQTAVQAFQSGSAGSKILIIISDGENHDGDPVNLAKAAAKNGITVCTVGIGNPAGELIAIKDAHGNPSYLKDSSGNVVKTALNESMLREIATAGNGVYVRGAGVSLGLESLFKLKLAGLNRGELSSRWQKRYIDRYQIPLLIGLFFLFLEYLLGIAWQRLHWPWHSAAAANRPKINATKP